MSPIITVYCFISITLAFIVKGLAGFGDPLVFTPLLSLCLPNSIITPAFSPISPLLNMGLVWKNRAHFSPKIVLPISAFNVLGTIPGIFLLKFGSPQWLKLLAGLAIIGFGVEMLTRKAAPGGKPNPVLRSLVSFLSGILSGLFGINLLFMAYMERVTANREEFRANACFVMLLENIFRVALYLHQGLFSATSLQLTLIALPAALLGMKVGGMLDKKIDDRRSRRILIYVFIAGGISTTIYALLQLF